jgi:ubiquinone/menaquinone biosynthesis C-methylase UbiE
MRDDVRAYYAGFGENEWTRLTSAAMDGVVEFAITTHTLQANLPSAARVLDVGGGPGRYAIWLAEQGHRVVLADLSPNLLQIARREIAHVGVAHMIEEIVEADVCDLSRWPDASFDAALCLGPFYHLTDPGDRERAATELARVVRPDGVVFIALMPRLAFLRRTLALPDERHHLAQPEFVARLLDHGIFLNDVPGRFTAGYGVRPQDVAPFFEGYGFATIALLAAEGVTAGLGEALASLAASDPETYRLALDLVLRTASEPGILGLCHHLLYVARWVL